MRIETHTPVVILRAVAHGPLGIVRSLGRLGVPMYVVDPDPRLRSTAHRKGWTVLHLNRPPVGPPPEAVPVPVRVLVPEPPRVRERRGR